MKKPLLSLLCLVTLGAGALTTLPALRAQDAPTADNAVASMPSPDQVVAMMDQKMHLSDDQKNQLTPIIANRQQQLKALRADQSMRRFQKMRSAKKIVEDGDKKINAILTPDQQKIYAELEKEMRDQMKDRMQNAN